MPPDFIGQSVFRNHLPSGKSDPVASPENLRRPVPISVPSTTELLRTTSAGVVVIGRNEGERLRRCLTSLAPLSSRTIYVDSGSTDGSANLSRGLGVQVLQLDSSRPFTAARARNEGFQRLIEIHPSLDYVFFVDGDCEVATAWIQTATRFLDEHPDAAIAWGIRRERHPERSIYNLLCDLEWASFPLGETTACGGDAVIRVSAFRQVRGYRASLICGEEPELCVRLRAAGWRIWHLDQDMTLHDAALYRFSQWWRRMVRGGYAYAQGAYLHGKLPERHWVQESRRAWIWGLGIPVATLGLTATFGAPGLLLLLVYPLQAIRLASRAPTHEKRWLRAGALVLSKFPEMQGQVKFTWDRIRGGRSPLIEYK